MTTFNIRSLWGAIALGAAVALGAYASYATETDEKEAPPHGCMIANYTKDREAIMNKAFILNAHQYYDFSPGKLNAEIIRRTEENLKRRGFEVRHSHVMDEYNVQEEVEKHRWANLVILQTPVNWMGVPWLAKKYMDEVYMAGTSGFLCNSDGRHASAPKDGYGSGGVLTGKKYMISLTFNAPKEAFDDPSQYLFEGKSVDDLFFPYHMNFRFFGMEPLPTFAVYDVMKSPETEKDFLRLEERLNHVIGAD